MSPQEALQVFGNTIECTYSRYQAGQEDIVFTYSGVSQAQGYTLVNENTTTFDPSSFDWLVYSSPVLYPDVRPSVITFDIKPTYSIFDTTQIHTALALTTGNNPSPSASVYNSPQWKWNIAGSDVTYENRDEDGNGLMAYFYGYTFQTANPFYYNYVVMDFSSQNRISGYSYRATFNGQYNDGYYWLMIACPYIDESASGESGIVTGTTASPYVVTIDVNVTVDNSVIESQLNDYLGGDDTNITTFAPVDLGTIPTIDINKLQHDVDIGDVIERTSSGLAVWWGLIGSVMSACPFLVWLVPVLIVVAVLGWALWRK